MRITHQPGATHPSAFSCAYCAPTASRDELRRQRDSARSLAADLEAEVAAYLPIVRYLAGAFCFDANRFDQPTDDPIHITPCAYCDARAALSRFDHLHGAT